MQATGEDDANARRWLRIRALFDEAMQLPAAERVEHVRRAVGTDADLARDVLEMLTLAAVPATPAEFAAARQQVRDLGVGSLGSHAAANLDQSPAADLLRQLLSAPRLDHERYARGEEIGRGGMGIVHRIHDRVLHRDLAIKSLRAAAPPTSEAAALARQELLSRFLAEAQLTSQLDHPGVVPVHELGLDQDGRIFFTMRLIAG